MSNHCQFETLQSLPDGSRVLHCPNCDKPDVTLRKGRTKYVRWCGSAGPMPIPENMPAMPTAKSELVEITPEIQAVADSLLLDIKQSYFIYSIDKWIKSGKQVRNEAEQVELTRVCCQCWRWKQCALIPLPRTEWVTWTCPISSWQWLGHGPGDELHKSIEWWTGESVTPTCGCGQWIAYMNANGCDWCVENINKIVTKMVEEANIRGGMKKLLATVPGASIGIKRIALAAIKRARQWQPAELPIPLPEDTFVPGGS